LLKQPNKQCLEFQKTCQKCFDDIEFSLPGHFSYGELVLQAKKGQNFYLAELINNKPSISLWSD